jgi:hypothetical protein
MAFSRGGYPMRLLARFVTVAIGVALAWVACSESDDPAVTGSSGTTSAGGSTASGGSSAGGSVGDGGSAGSPVTGGSNS